MSTNPQPGSISLSKPDGEVIDPARADGEQPQNIKRVATASFVGTLIEFYDFGIYGFAAALVFGHVFFPALGGAAATLAAFATFGVAFVARPVGAVLFGHFGDRLGRKKTLVVTLLMMGTATVLVGAMPSAEMIGIAAPIGLVVLRIVQGLAAGGEWAGAVLFAAENAPKNKRGFWSMFASLGAGIAVALAPLTFLVTGLLMSDESFLAYGWRIPFLLSTVLLALGMWIRFSMEETPVFKSEMEQGKAATIPFVEAIKHKGKTIGLAGGMMILTFSYGYLGVTYLTNYGTATLGFERPMVLTISVAGGLFYTLGILLSGLYSDTFGRRRVVITAAIAGLVWALILFPLINTGFIAVFGLGVIVTLFIAGIALGPMSAFVSELFPTRYRYTAVGLSYNIAGVVGGAITPLLGVSITAAYGAIAFSFLLAGLALFSLICVLMLKESKDNELDEISA